MTAKRSHLNRVLVFGYFGGRNFGDELMLLGLIAELRARGAGAIRIIAPQGKVPPHLEGQVERAYRKAPAGLGSGLAWASALVVCGGTMFHDSFPEKRHRAYRRNLAAIAGLCAAARVMGRKVLLLGVGIGPLRRRFTRAAARVAIAAASDIRVRDRCSLEDIEALCGGSPKLSLGRDLAFFAVTQLPVPAPNGRPTLVLSLVPADLVSTTSSAQAGAFLDCLLEELAGHLEQHPQWRVAVLAAAVGEVDDDRLIAAHVASRLSAAFRGRVEPLSFDGDPLCFLRTIASARAVIASRYHVATAAELIGAPTLWLPYQRKVADGAAELGVEDERVIPLTPAGAKKAAAWLNALAEADERQLEKQM